MTLQAQHCIISSHAPQAQEQQDILIVPYSTLRETEHLGP
jgi:hypothetical protein